MKHFDSHKTAWIPSYPGGTLDGISMIRKDDGTIEMWVHADGAANMRLTKRQITRLQKLLEEIKETL